MSFPQISSNQSIRLSIFPHPNQISALSNFFISANLMGEKWSLLKSKICISLIMSNNRNFICMQAICISFPINSLLLPVIFRWLLSYLTVWALYILRKLVHLIQMSIFSCQSITHFLILLRLFLTKQRFIIPMQSKIQILAPIGFGSCALLK